MEASKAPTTSGVTKGAVALRRGGKRRYDFEDGPELELVVQECMRRSGAATMSEVMRRALYSFLGTLSLGTEEHVAAIAVRARDALKKARVRQKERRLLKKKSGPGKEAG